MANDVLGETLIFESKGSKGARLADQWRRALPAKVTQMPGSVAKRGSGGASRRPVWLEPNVHRERWKK